MGTQLQRAVEVMDRLRSPSGCPWDAAQTHASLARYLVEETYELLEAIETGDLRLLREELGDLLLQVLFHARLTQELPPGQAFGIDDVAGDLVDKLIRRHPHVFAGAQLADPEQLNDTWERQKVTEKGRTSAVDGVPVAQPALALTAKLLARAQRAGLQVSPEPTTEFGARLFAVAGEAVAAGVDPESALRETARAYRAAILAAEASGADTAGRLEADPSARQDRVMTGAVTRTEPTTTGGERETLIGFLDYYRATLALKCQGLSPAQLATRASPPSSLSLLGLVRHMAEVERGWFRGFAGETSAPRYYSDADPDGDFDNAIGEQHCVDEAFDYWHTEVAHAREVAAAAPLEQTFHRARNGGETISLRWILVHMVEEYARHCGHADLLRERLDGVTGD